MWYNAMKEALRLLKALCHMAFYRRAAKKHSAPKGRRIDILWA
jgi:hypothetical protein